MAATVGLGVFALRNESATYVVPAITCAGYTVASINNAFDQNLGISAFLDSPIMITMLSLLLGTCMMKGPTGSAFLLFAACCLPFFVDFYLSMKDSYKRGSGTSYEGQGATVTELDDSEHDERFQSAD